MQFHSETMWIENRIEDLDKPGEWVFDAENRKIILWPTTDTPSNEIVAPLLTELVRIEGAIDYAGPTDEPVRNVNFHGLTFAHAERLPRPGQDGWDLQHCWEHFDCPSALAPASRRGELLRGWLPICRKRRSRRAHGSPLPAQSSCRLRTGASRRRRAFCWPVMGRAPRM